MTKSKKFSLKLPKKVTISNMFKEGDIICSVENYKVKLIFFFIANEQDVEEYSGKNKRYIILS